MIFWIKTKHLVLMVEVNLTVESVSLVKLILMTENAAERIIDVNSLKS